jgi:hypothetical protein
MLPSACVHYSYFSLLIVVAAGDAKNASALSLTVPCNSGFALCPMGNGNPSTDSEKRTTKFCADISAPSTDTIALSTNRSSRGELKMQHIE